LYREYCEGNCANEYYCAGYKFVWTLGRTVQRYNGAITAFATAIIGAFTIVLAYVTNRQAKLTRESIDLAREELVSTHRPKIVVYGLGFVGDSPNADSDSEEPIRVSFRFVNSGDTPAKITMIGTKLIHLFKTTMPSDF
jgi:hypothetical protein